MNDFFHVLHFNNNLNDFIHCQRKILCFKKCLLNLRILNVLQRYSTCYHRFFNVKLLVFVDVIKYRFIKISKSESFQKSILLTIMILFWKNLSKNRKNYYLFNLFIKKYAYIQSMSVIICKYTVLPLQIRVTLNKSHICLYWNLYV